MWSTPESHANHHEEDRHEWCPSLDRRAALRLLSLSAIASAAGCGSSSTAGTATATTTDTAASTTTLATSASTVTAGSKVTVTATVNPSTATGTVTSYDGTASLGTGTLSSGVATLAATFNTAGTQTLTAAYAGSAAYAASTSTAVSLAVTAGTAACAATLEGEEGPYFVDDSASGYLRSNILSNLDGSQTQAGVPLTLTVYVFDSKNSCGPMQGVQVDIWHCNAAGIYSAESVEGTVGQSWLRGYQITDATGKVQFTTILPGWYQGRTTHIHLRFRSTYDSTSNSGTNTSQIFFDQTLIDPLDISVAPYKSEGKNPTTNVGDHVYTGEMKGAGLVALTGSAADGYTATFNAFMPI